MTFSKMARLRQLGFRFGLMEHGLYSVRQAGERIPRVMTEAEIATLEQRVAQHQESAGKEG